MKVKCLIEIQKEKLSHRNAMSLNLYRVEKHAEIPNMNGNWCDGESDRRKTVKNRFSPRVPYSSPLCILSFSIVIWWSQADSLMKNLGNSEDRASGSQSRRKTRRRDGQCKRDRKRRMRQEEWKDESKWWNRERETCTSHEKGDAVLLGEAGSVGTIPSHWKCCGPYTITLYPLQP